MSEQLPNLDPALLGDPPPSPGTGRASSCSTARPASAPSAACWCWRPHACSNASVPKRGFSTLPGCHCPMMHRWSIPRSASCATWCSGRKARSGARPSATVRCPRYSRRRSTGFPGTRGGAPDPGQDPGADAGLRRLAVVQRGQPVARAGSLDAHVHHPQPVLGSQGLPGVRRSGPDEAIALLRPGGRRDGGVVRSPCSCASARTSWWTAIRSARKAPSSFPRGSTSVRSEPHPPHSRPGGWPKRAR